MQGATADVRSPCRPRDDEARYVRNVAAHRSVNRGRLVTPLEVLDNVFGGVPDDHRLQSLDAADVDGLSCEVLQAAETLAHTKAAPEAYGDLIYPGGWLASGWGETLFRPELNQLLLYQPRLLVHDPLAEYFFSDFDWLPRLRPLKGNGVMVIGGPHIWANYGRRANRGDDIVGVRQDLTRIVSFLRDIEPLIRAGVVVLRSQWPTIRSRQRQVVRSALDDMASPAMIKAAKSASAAGGFLPKWDNIRGLQVTPAAGLIDAEDPAQWEAEFFYLAKTLAVADAAGATFVPDVEDEVTLLTTKVERGPSRSRPSGRVLREVLRVVIPDMALDAVTAIKIRESEEAFEQWRREMRDIQREASTLDDDASVRELVDDRLGPTVRAVNGTIARSAVLKKRVKGPLVAAVIAGGTAAVTGTPSVITGAAGAIGAVGRWIEDAFIAKRPDGSRPVVAALLRNGGT